jgi:hypothetical protein
MAMVEFGLKTSKLGPRKQLLPGMAQTVSTVTSEKANKSTALKSLELILRMLKLTTLCKIVLQAICQEPIFHPVPAQQKMVQLYTQRLLVETPYQSSLPDPISDSYLKNTSLKILTKYWSTNIFFLHSFHFVSSISLFFSLIH